MLAPLPLGLRDAPRKAEKGAIEKGKKDTKAYVAKNAAELAASNQFYGDMQKRLAARGPLLGPPRFVPGNELPSTAGPVVPPSENDPNRMYQSLGKGPPLTNRDIMGDPPPAMMGEGVGGPQEKPPPEDELAQIEKELARRELEQIQQELAARGESPATPGEYDPSQIDDYINESVKQIPGGYKAWLEKNQPAPPGQHYERDPLAKGEKYYLAPDTAPGKPQEFGGNNTLDLGLGRIPLGQRDDPWNIQVADILDRGVEGIMDVTKGQKDQSVKPLGELPFIGKVGASSDPLAKTAETFAEPLLRFPSAAFRSPGQATVDYDPFHQAGRAYNNVQGAITEARQGNWAGVAQKGYDAAIEGGNAFLAIAGLKGAPAPRNPLAPKGPPVREPTVKQAGKVLAAEAIPGRKIRPQAMKALERILSNSGVPRDRIVGGLGRVVESLKGVSDGDGLRAPTIAQLLEREFGPEFPEVRQNIRTVLLERRLTKERGDSSPTIVRETVQDMRGSQVPFLEDAAAKNMGDNSRNATREELAAEMKRIGDEGYKPILSQPADAARAKKIQDVIYGPGMGEIAGPMRELSAPLRQFAAAEGLDLDGMIAAKPIEAAHWMQHKARLLADAAKRSGNGAMATAYNKLRDRLLGTIDDVNGPDGKTYAEVRKLYGDEAQIGQALDAGDNFGAISRNPDSANQFVETINGMAPRQREAAMQSIRDWILSKLRGGGEEAAARLGDLQSIAVLDTLDKLGSEGKSMADAIRSVRDEEIFLKDFYPKGESATITNREALSEGPSIYTRGGPKSGKSGTMMTDAALMASGMSHAPVLSILKKTPEVYSGMMRPRKATREDMTRVLTARPGTKGAPTKPGPKGPPTGGDPGPGKLSKEETMSGVERLHQGLPMTEMDAQDFRNVLWDHEKTSPAELRKILGLKSSTPDNITRTIAEQTYREAKKVYFDKLKQEQAGAPPPKTEAPSQGGAPSGIREIGGGGPEMNRYAFDASKGYRVEIGILKDGSLHFGTSPQKYASGVGGASGKGQFTGAEAAKILRGVNEAIALDAQKTGRAKYVLEPQDQRMQALARKATPPEGYTANPTQWGVEFLKK